MTVFHQIGSIHQNDMTEDSIRAEAVEIMLNAFPDAMVDGAPEIIRGEDTATCLITFSSQIYDMALSMAMRAIFTEIIDCAESLRDAPFLTQEKAEEYLVVINAVLDRARATFTESEDE